MKTEINELITGNNAEIGSLELWKIVGEYYPDYLDEERKNTQTWRPIISQIPTFVKQLAKTLNQMMRLYLPSKFNILRANSSTYYTILKNKIMVS